MGALLLILPNSTSCLTTTTFRNHPSKLSSPLPRNHHTITSSLNFPLSTTTHLRINNNNRTTQLGLCFSGLRPKMATMDDEESNVSGSYSRISAFADDNGPGNTGGGTGNGGASGSGGGGDNVNDDSGGGSFFSWYLELLAKFPVLTKAVTSALLSLVGDLICQLLIDKVVSLDIKRSFMFAFLGLVLVGPALHFWYLYLSKLVTVPGASGAFLRLLLDQFLFAPAFIGVFLSALVTLEGRPSEVVPKLKQEWFSSVLANWKLWIPFQFLNFRFVPQQFQVLASNFVALVWNVILSFIAHKEVVPK